MILVDINEKSTAPDVFQQLVDHFGDQGVFPTNLPYGDIAIPLTTGLLRIERKTVSDLAASAKSDDNRLYEQVDGMVKDADFAMVLITGRIAYNEDDYLVIGKRVTGWRGVAIRGALRSIQMAGVGVEFCAPGNYARTVDEMIRTFSKTDHRHYSIRNRNKKPVIDFYPDDASDRERIEFISGIPGIGPVLARSLLEWCGGADKLGTIAEALAWITLFPEMDSKALPEGWGPVKALQARDFLGLEAGHVLEQRQSDLAKEVIVSLEAEHAD